MTKHQKPIRPRNKLYLIAGGVLALVLLGTAVVLEATNKTHFIGKDTYETAPKTEKRTANANTKGETAEGDQKSSQGSGENQSAIDNKGNENTNTTAPLDTPTGTFVSNHTPNLDGSPHPNVIQSNCVSTAGATCTITFTKDGVTKSLPAQTADKGGATYWTWTLQDIGLSEGTWSIEAKATLGSQTKTAADPIKLEVKS